MRHLLIVFLIAASATLAQGGSQIPASDVIKQVPPDYPKEARLRHETGRGVLILHVDRARGVVTSVTVFKSTGHKILDDAGVRAFSQWRFKPGVVKDPLIKVPISFHTS
jgi:TonB family protein